MKAFLAVALLLLAASATGQESRSDRKGEAVDWIAKAAEALNFEGSGKPPFRLRAKVRLFGRRGEPKFSDGTYSLVWKSPLQWREELSYPGYDEIRVATGEKLWVKRNLDYIPLSVSRLERFFVSGYLSGLQPDARVARVKESSRKRLKLTCATLEWKDDLETEFCFDRNSFDLHLLRWKGILGETRFEFDELLRTKNGPFPRHIHHVYEGDPAFDAETIELSFPEQIDSAELIPPEGAEAWDRCEKPTGLKWEVSQLPPPSFEDILVGRSWLTHVYVVVKPNGSLERAKVVDSSYPSQNQELLEGLQKTRFTPETCHGKPIRSEEIIMLSFSVGHP